MLIHTLYHNLTSLPPPPLSQLPDLLTIYEAIRKPRTTRVVTGATQFGRETFHLHDGPRQRERDRQLLEWDDKPFEGYPNRWRDPVFQEFLFGYDAKMVVEEAWARYVEGRFPGTMGRFAEDVDGGVKIGAAEVEMEADVQELRRLESRESGGGGRDVRL